EDVIADGRREVPKDFTNYASVVLNNAAKSQLPGDFLANLRRFVESGGGLLVLGGDRSFGLGGYINTSLEEISPLKFVPPRTEKRRLITAVVLLIDKSGSMAEQNKIQSAKLAALMSINALKDEDFISVIGFDHAPFVIIDLKKVDEVKPQAPRRLENLTAAGQTNLLPALAAARQKLSNSAASRKHVIVLSDGKFPLSDAPYIDEINQLRKDGVTVSAVALGFEADVPFMKLLSQHGRGAFYHTLDPSQLPQVFVQDIKVATGEKTMKEAQEYPVGIGPGGMVSASPAQFPALRGFVETLPKKGSTLELITRSEGQVFPVLASWIYGKGKVIAFTSDANGRWSLPWLRWPGFFGFWSDIVEKIKDRSGRKGGEIDFDLRYSINRKSLLLDLSIFDEHLQTGAAPRISGELLAPGGEKKEVIFQQARKGRFEGVLADAEPGDYKIDLTYGSLKLPPLAISIGGEAFGEIPGRGIQVQNLAQAAYLTGGIVNPLSAQVYANKRISETARPLYAPLVLLAFALILAEAFVREVGATGLIALFQRRKGAGADARRVKGRYYDAKRRALY
ncbi:MAG TPA: VWA domain-containing protein, partial [Oligoflexia bacterium]|nr:VWA domain-containing protein [Oligoflexia bacterium]